MILRIYDGWVLALSETFIPLTLRFKDHYRWGIRKNVRTTRTGECIWNAIVILQAKQLSSGIQLCLLTKDHHSWTWTVTSPHWRRSRKDHRNLTLSSTNSSTCCGQLSPKRTWPRGRDWVHRTKKTKIEGLHFSFMWLWESHCPCGEKTFQGSFMKEYPHVYK